MESKNPILSFWQKSLGSKLIVIIVGFLILAAIIGVLTPQGQKSLKEGQEVGKGTSGNQETPKPKVERKESKNTPVPTKKPTPTPSKSPAISNKPVPKPTTSPKPKPNPTVPPKNNSSKVTLEQFNRLQEGMTYQEIVSILGSEGEVLSSSDIAGYKTIMYMWEGNSFGGNMNAMFQNGAMVSKAQFGLK